MLLTRTGVALQDSQAHAVGGGVVLGVPDAHGTVVSAGPEVGPQGQEASHPVGVPAVARLALHRAHAPLAHAEIVRPAPYTRACHKKPIEPIGL